MMNQKWVVITALVVVLSFLIGALLRVDLLIMGW